MNKIVKFLSVSGLALGLGVGVVNTFHNGESANVEASSKRSGYPIYSMKKAAKTLGLLCQDFGQRNANSQWYN